MWIAARGCFISHDDELPVQAEIARRAEEEDGHGEEHELCACCWKKGGVKVDVWEGDDDAPLRSGHVVNEDDPYEAHGPRAGPPGPDEGDAGGAAPATDGATTDGAATPGPPVAKKSSKKMPIRSISTDSMGVLFNRAMSMRSVEEEEEVEEIDLAEKLDFFVWNPSSISGILEAGEKLRGRTIIWLVH